MIKQTLSEYMNNPAGKGSTVIPNRQLLIDDYRRRYEKIKEHHKFDVTIYKIDEDYIFHVLVPSEDKDKDVYYDVVLQFTMHDEDFKNDININRYYVKFFSNSPSFVYSYAYVYNKNGIMVDTLKNKFNHDTLTVEPTTRNPYQIISFEKTVYFACLHIMNTHKYMNKLYLNSHIRSLRPDLLQRKVRTADSILMEYNRAKKKKEEKIRLERNKVKASTVHKTTETKKSTQGKKIASTPKQKKQPAKKITAKKSTIKGRK